MGLSRFDAVRGLHFPTLMKESRKEVIDGSSHYMGKPTTNSWAETSGSVEVIPTTNIPRFSTDLSLIQFNLWAFCWRIF